jgi:hypothetical protein
MNRSGCHRLNAFWLPLPGVTRLATWTHTGCHQLNVLNVRFDGTITRVESADPTRRYPNDGYAEDEEEDGRSASSKETTKEAGEEGEDYERPAVGEAEEGTMVGFTS